VHREGRSGGGGGGGGGGAMVGPVWDQREYVKKKKDSYPRATRNEKGKCARENLWLGDNLTLCQDSENQEAQRGRGVFYVSNEGQLVGKMGGRGASHWKGGGEKSECLLGTTEGRSLPEERGERSKQGELLQNARVLIWAGKQREGNRRSDGSRFSIPPEKMERKGVIEDTGKVKQMNFGKRLFKRGEKVTGRGGKRGTLGHAAKKQGQGRFKVHRLAGGNCWVRVKETPGGLVEFVGGEGVEGLKKQRLGNPRRGEAGGYTLPTAFMVGRGATTHRSTIP